MTKKHAPKRKTKPPPPSSYRPRQPFKQFIRRNSVGLLSILVSVLTALLIYYLAYSEPDIRPMTELTSPVEISQPTKDKNGNCFYYCLIKQRFKNLSIKRGHIEAVTFEPLGPADVIPEFTLINVDKAQFGWREEKEIEISYSMSLSPSACSIMSNRNDFLSVGVSFYDNTGKSVDRDLSGGRALMSFDIPFPKFTSP